MTGISVKSLVPVLGDAIDFAMIRASFIGRVVIPSVWEVTTAAALKLGKRSIAFAPEAPIPSNAAQCDVPPDGYWKLPQ